MSSLIKILLKNPNILGSDNSSKETQTLNPGSNPESVQVRNLFYTLIEKEKYQLLQTILVNLKKEQEVYEQKISKQGQLKTLKLNRPQVIHEDVLQSVTLSEFINRLKQSIGFESLEVDKEDKKSDYQLKQLINCLLENNLSKVVNFVDFFANCVFSSRKILPSQIQIIQVIIQFIQLTQFPQEYAHNDQTCGKNKLQGTKDKWKVMLDFARQPQNIQKSTQNQINDNNFSQQLSGNTQLDSEISIKWMFLLSENQRNLAKTLSTHNQTLKSSEQNQQITSSKSSLLSIYQQAIKNSEKVSAEYYVQSLKQQRALVGLVLPGLIELYKSVSMSKIESQVGQIFRQFLPQLSLSNIQTAFKQDECISNNREEIVKLIRESSRQWLKVQFLEITIGFFVHELNITIKTYQDQDSTEDKQKIEQQKAKIELKIACMQSVISTLTETYCDFLTYINHILKEWLQNDIKNNYYLSSFSKLHFIVHLNHLINWIAPSFFGNPFQHTLLHASQQPLDFSALKQKYLTEFTSRKRLKFDCHSFGKHIHTVFSFVNQEANKIASFLSISQQGASNRLLSQQQYQFKVEQSLNHIVSNTERIKQKVYIGLQNNDCDGKDIHSAFVFWFVSQPHLNFQQKKSKIQKIYHAQIKKTKSIKFASLSYQKLKFSIFKQNIKSNNKFSIKCLIEQILRLNENSQSFIQQTFEFHSPTFNQQYLTFSYIYGDTKDVYFYQNHHYSHILLTIYQTLIQSLMNDPVSFKSSQQFLIEVFNHLRNQIGSYAKEHLVQANSKPFYEYLNMFKFAHLTLTRPLLQLVSIDELILTYDLILNQIIVKENHPLIRQYIEVLMARIYFTIKQRVFSPKSINLEKPSIVQKDQSTQSKDEVSQTEEKDQRKQIEQNVRKFHNCRTRMINMLDYDEENLHNLNIGVPILMILGYQLISCVEQQNFTTSQRSIESTSINSNEFSQEYSLGQQKPINDELDIHYILIKYISCHVAYSRAICQYYMSKFLQLRKQNLKVTNDALLESLSHFWFADKDSVNIMKNISVAVEGFKIQIDNYLKGQPLQNFYLGFQRVEEYPQFQSDYFLLTDTIQVLKTLLDSQNIQLSFDFKILLGQKLLFLKKKAIQMERQKVQQIYEQEYKKPKQQTKPKKNDKKKEKHLKDNKKPKQKPQNEQPIQNQHKIQNSQQTQQQAIEEIIIKLNNKLQKQYKRYQETQEPKVIIIATLLQKVHNFGYLVRTLTSHRAMLVVPSPQPFIHPQCKQLLPTQEQIDVKVIEIRPKQLQSFIKMYQQRGYPLIALQQCSKSIQLEKTIFPQKYMLLLGNERIGAPASLLSMADILVEIPQIGKVRSLNVHVSMVICFWQYLKQANRKKELKALNNSKYIKNNDKFS